MMMTLEQLPLTETIAPEDEASVCDAIAGAAVGRTPIYPIGGGTSLDFGLVPRLPGLGLRTTSLSRLIDYPARDMTITAQAGMTFAELAGILAAERQRLPIDPPQAGEATLGGILATNSSGPRRFGCGSIRDYVIGVTAVEGRGRMFHGGGRVVKNVAGYDFCRLLVGSLGTLGVITQLTFKVVPTPDRSLLVQCPVRDWAEAERLLADLVDAPITPTAVQLAHVREIDEIVSRRASDVASLLVGLEGTGGEVDWMRETLAARWRVLGIRAVECLDREQAEAIWQWLVEFPATDASPLVIRANLRPSRVAEYCKLILEHAPDAELLADGCGQVLAKFAALPADASGLLIQTLQPAAARDGGNVAVVRRAEPEGWTRQAVWGGRTDADGIAESIRRQFDPQGILNPGRWGDGGPA